MNEFDRNLDEDEAIFRDVMEACRCCDGTSAIALQYVDRVRELTRRLAKLEFSLETIDNCLTPFSDNSWEYIDADGSNAIEVAEALGYGSFADWIESKNG